jgi:hypothetical protein
VKEPKEKMNGYTRRMLTRGTVEEQIGKDHEGDEKSEGGNRMETRLTVQQPKEKMSR